MTKRILVLTLPLLLSACAIPQTEKKVDDAAIAVNAMRTLAERNATNSAVIRSKRQRLAGRQVTLNANELPAWFQQPHAYSTKGTQSVVSVLDYIAKASGISIKQSEIAAIAGNASIATAAFASRNNDPVSGNLSLQYSGTTRGLFDAIASKANITWRYNQESNAVEFFRFETRTLSLSLPAGSKTISADISLTGVSGGGGGDAGGGGSTNAGNVAVSQTQTINPWASVMAGVGAILNDCQGAATDTGQAPPPSKQSAGDGQSALTVSGVNGNVIAIPELGFMTITGRPTAVERVARYVASIDARFAKNVLIDVKMYSVSLDEQSSLGFNLNMLYGQMGKLGGTIVGPAPLQAGTGTPGLLTLTATNPSSHWNGSTIVGQALSQFGKVSLQKQGQVLAVNGQPSPLQVANEISYVASSSTTQSPNVGSVTTQTQGVKIVGFTANFKPLILSDNRILLEYQMQISQLVAPLTPNAAGVQSPNISKQSLQQQAFVKDGQAIVLFGFDDSRDGVDSSTNLGGASKAAHSERQMIVIVMQVNTGEKNG